MFMKKISKIFPVMMMEAEIDNYNSINARLKTEIKSLFDKINEKRVLSHKWDDFLITENTHELGYTSFNSKDYHDLTKISEFDFFYNHISTNMLYQNLVTTHYFLLLACIQLMIII